MDLSEIIPDKIKNGIDNCIVEKQIEAEWILVKFRFESGRTGSVKLKRFINERIFFFGLGLFAGEGTRKRRPSNIKRGNSVELTNSNPLFIQCFMQFLEELGFSKEKLKARIQISCKASELNKMRERSLKFWLNATNIPKENFNKPNIRIRTQPKQKSEFGSVAVTLFSQPLWRLLEFWIQDRKLIDGSERN